MSSWTHYFIMLPKYLALYLNQIYYIIIIFLMITNGRKIAENWCRPDDTFFALFLLIYGQKWAHTLIFRWYTPPVHGV